MKTKKLIKRGVTLLLATLVTLGGVACGQNVTNGGVGGSTGDETQIYVKNFGGGVGVKWLEEAAARFAETVKDKSYETNKKGVSFQITSNAQINTSTMASDGDALYFAPLNGTPYSLAGQGVVYNLDDIMTAKVYNNNTKSIEDKMSAEGRELCKGADGSYYGMPHYEIYPCLTINRAIYDEYGLYIGAPDSTAETYTRSKFGTAKILGVAGMQSGAKKSCGVDGEYGTEDDGLPTSIQELLILCSYMKSECDVVPFTVAGNLPEYHSMFIYGMMASLMGAESYKAMFSFDGQMEIVTDFSTEDLFYNGSGIKKPNTKLETITDQNGYLVREASARYYATAFTQIAVAEDWFSADADSPSTSHLATQRNFINGGKQSNKAIAMLVEGNYWMNESDTAGYYKQYKTLYGKDPQIEIVPFPVQLEGSVAENQGKEYTRASHISYVYVNKKVENQPGVLDAVTDFLYFLHEEEEMQRFTATTGSLLSSFDYDFDSQTVMSDMHDVKKSSIRYTSNSKRVIIGSANPIYANSVLTFAHDINTATFRADVYPGQVNYASYFDAIKGGVTARQIFDYFKMTESTWRTVHLGE